MRVEQDETWRAPLDDEANQQYLLTMIQTKKDSLAAEEDLPEGTVQMQLQAGTLEDGTHREGDAPLDQATMRLANATGSKYIIHDGGHTPDAWASGLAIMLPVSHPKRAPSPVDAIHQNPATQYKQVISGLKATTSAAQSLTKPGTIILLCGTSTAGKTSICTAVQREARKDGHEWVVDGGDIASDKAWTEPCEIAGKKYLSAQDHLVNAMKNHVDPTIVDTAVKTFGARTLAVALFSRKNLGHPKVDQVNLKPEADIKKQALGIYNALSPENQNLYKPADIENLLIIIRDCPEPEAFLEQYPYPPLADLNKLMLDRAIVRAKNGESTIFDIIGNEVIDGQRIVDQFHDRLEEAGLPPENGTIVMVHCAVPTLIDRMNSRNQKAIAEGRKDDVRAGFFPFEQYGLLYEKAPVEPDPTKPIVGIVTRQDITEAARQFGKEADAIELLTQLGFTDGEDSVAVTSRGKNDAIFQSGSQSSQQIAELLCEKAFGSAPSPNNTALRLG